MKDYSKMELWELFHFLNEGNAREIDSHLASQLFSAEDIFAHYWHFSYIYSNFRPG